MLYFPQVNPSRHSPEREKGPDFDYFYQPIRSGQPAPVVDPKDVPSSNRSAGRNIVTAGRGSLDGGNGLCGKQDSGGVVVFNGKAAHPVTDGEVCPVYPVANKQRMRRP